MGEPPLKIRQKKLPVVRAEPKEGSHLCETAGVGHSHTASILAGSGVNPCALIRWPRKPTRSVIAYTC